MNYTFHGQIRASKESDHSSPRTTQNVLRRKWAYEQPTDNFRNPRTFPGFSYIRRWIVFEKQSRVDFCVLYGIQPF